MVKVRRGKKKDEDAAARAAATSEALESEANKAVEVLPRLGSMSQDERLLTLLALAQARPSAAILKSDALSRVAHAMSDPNADVRVAAAAALAHLVKFGFRSKSPGDASSSSLSSSAAAADGDVDVADVLGSARVDVATQVVSSVNRVANMLINKTAGAEVAEAELALLEQCLTLTESLCSLSATAAAAISSGCAEAVLALFFAGPAMASRRVSDAAGAALVAISEDDPSAAAAIARGATDLEAVANGSRGVLLAVQASTALWNACSTYATGRAESAASGLAATLSDPDRCIDVVWNPLLAAARDAAQANPSDVRDVIPADPSVVQVDERGADADADMADGAGGRGTKKKGKDGAAASAAVRSAIRKPVAEPAEAWLSWVAGREAQLLAVQTLSNIVAAIVDSGRGAGASGAGEGMDMDGDESDGWEDEDAGSDGDAGPGIAETEVKLVRESGIIGIALTLASTQVNEEFEALAADAGAEAAGSLRLPYLVREGAVALLANLMPFIDVGGAPFRGGMFWTGLQAEIIVTSRKSAAGASAAARGLVNLASCLLRRIGDEDDALAAEVVPAVTVELHAALTALCAVTRPQACRATALTGVGLLCHHCDVCGLPRDDAATFGEAAAITVALRSDDAFLSCAAADAAMDAFSEPSSDAAMAKVGLLNSLVAYAKRAREIARDLEGLGSRATEEQIDLRASLLDVAANIKRFQEYKTQG